MQKENNVFSIELNIDLSIDKERVWKALVHDVNLWWRTDFYSSSKTKKMIIEANVGGRMYEDYGSNEGLLWATVIALDSPNTIEFKGTLSPDFGGPALSFLKLSLKKNGNSTLLTVRDTLFGDINENTKKEIEHGWKLLYEDSFKSYVEANSI